MTNVLQISFCLALFWVCAANCAELTFELHERKKDCFYENFQIGENAQIDFRVLSGGNADVTVRLFDPSDEPVFSADKESKGGKVFQVSQAGVYKACFSNEFSAVSRKLVYFALRSGRPDSVENDNFMPPPQLSSSSIDSTSETEQHRHRMLMSMQIIGGALNSISDYQRHVRLVESADRRAAEATLSRVGAWSLVEILVVLAAAGAQVLAVRKLFPAGASAGIMGRRA